MSYDKAVELTAKLSLEEKVAFLTGFDFWNTVPNDRIGLRKLLLSDGPAGVRGEFWDERDNSLNLPSGSALGSTWSRTVAKEYGEILAVEAERKRLTELAKENQLDPVIGRANEIERLVQVLEVIERRIGLKQADKIGNLLGIAQTKNAFQPNGKLGSLNRLALTVNLTFRQRP